MALRDELILYHYAMSGSSQKLRLALAEKALVWKDIKLTFLGVSSTQMPIVLSIRPASCRRSFMAISDSVR